MKSRGPYRRHSTPFKLQLCQDIRNGVIGRRDAQRTYSVSANLIQLWLTQFDRGELNDEEAEASVIAEYEAHIAALERKVGQLTMELDLVKKTPRHPIDGKGFKSRRQRARCNHRGYPGRAALLRIPARDARASAKRPLGQPQACRPRHAGQWPRYQASQAVCSYDG